MKMDNTINGRTPDEIKKGLECCNAFNACPRCPYEKTVDTEHGWGCVVIRNADTLAYIHQLEAATPKWISVKDELPEVVVEYPSDKRTEYVVAISKDGVLHVGRFYIYKGDGSFEFVSGYERFDATHWMPLPEPPQESA